MKGRVAFAFVLVALLAVPVTGAPAYVAATSNNSADATVAVLSLTTPTVTVDDVMLAVITAEEGTGVTITPPAGWDLVRRDDEGTNLAQAVYLRVANGSESGSYSWSFSPDVKAAGGILAYGGIDPVDPVMASSGASDTGSSTVLAPGLTTTMDGTMLVGFFGVAKKNVDIDPPVGMTERLDTGEVPTKTAVTVAAADKIQASAGASGDQTGSSSPAGKNIGQLVALRPAGDGGPPVYGAGNPTSFHTGNTAVSSVSPLTPSNAAANDLLLAVITAGQGTGLTITAPAGWDLVRRDDHGNNLAQAIYSRVATGTEPASYTWSFSTNVKASGGVMLYTAIDTASPVAAHSGQTGTGSTISAPSVSTVREQSYVAFFSGIAKKNVALSPPVDLTERFDTTGLSGSNDVHTAGADRLQAAIGPTGVLSGSASTNGNNIGQTVVLNPVTVGFQASSSSTAESGTKDLAVILSGASSAATEVSYTVAGTATSADHALVAGTLTIQAGQTSGTIAVPITADTIHEPDETVIVTLTGATNALLTTTVHTLTIQDDDPVPTLGFATGAVASAEAVSAPVQVVLSNPSYQTVSVNVAWSGGTATAPDATLSSTTLTFPPGTTSVSVPLSIVDEATVEPDETIQLTLSAPVGATLGTTTHTYTIVDDDGNIAVSADPVDAAGALLAGVRWGAWSAAPGTTATSTNYLKVVNEGAATQSFTVSFTGPFTGVTSPSHSVALANAVAFAAFEDKTPATTAPSEGTYTFGAPTSGSATFSFTAKGAVMYIAYQVTLPSVLLDQVYSAPLSVSPV